MTREQAARDEIDRLLVTAGWEIHDRKESDETAVLSVAAREFAFDQDEVVHFLYVEGNTASVIEAK